jgi:hypothetical protein
MLGSGDGEAEPGGGAVHLGAGISIYSTFAIIVEKNWQLIFPFLGVFVLVNQQVLLQVAFHSSHLWPGSVFYSYKSRTLGRMIAREHR